LSKFEDVWELQDGDTDETKRLIGWIPTDRFLGPKELLKHGIWSMDGAPLQVQLYVEIELDADLTILLVDVEAKAKSGDIFGPSIDCDVTESDDDVVDGMVEAISAD